MINKYVTVNAPADYFDGVEWNPASPGTTLTRVGNPLYTNNHPIHKACKPVLLLDNGTENGDLASWANPTLTGDLTGASGQCMLKIPSFYYKERLTDGELSGLYVSDYKLPGFRLHEKYAWGNGRNEIYVSLFEGYLNAGKLSSIAGFVPTASRTMAQYRADAAARGNGFHGYDYYSQHLLQLLFYIWYAELNSQAVLPAYTEHGYTESARRITGRTKLLATVNGSVNADEAGLDADLSVVWLNTSRVIGNRFLWIENFYGHLWKFADGCSFDGRVGNPNTAYITADPSKFSSIDANILANYTNMNVDLPALVNENYLQSMGPLFLPKKHGGSSSTYTSDYFWSYLDDATRNYLRVVIVGGSLGISGPAGVAARLSNSSLGLAYSAYVSRLCFEKNT